MIAKYKTTAVTVIGMSIAIGSPIENNPFNEFATNLYKKISYRDTRFIKNYKINGELYMEIIHYLVSQFVQCHLVYVKIVKSFIPPYDCNPFVLVVLFGS